jgi:hypothetical protein
METLALSFLCLALCASLQAEDSVQAVSALPDNIKPEPGKLSLYADYSATGSEGQIPVYLINQTTKEVMLKAQDGYVYLKLETRNAEGKWIRAQPHAYSWCGNSYFDHPVVPAGHFMIMCGYQPKEGKKQEIRYALYGQETRIVSNAGEGLAAARDIDLASRDAMAVQEGDFGFVSNVALGEISLKNEMDHIKDLQGLAISTLASGRFDEEKARGVLSQVLEKCPDRKDDVSSALDQLKERHAKKGTPDSGASGPGPR